MCGLYHIRGNTVADSFMLHRQAAESLSFYRELDRAGGHFKLGVTEHNEKTLLRENWGRVLAHI